MFAIWLKENTFWDSTKQPTKALLTIQNVYKAYYTFDSV